MNMQEEIVVSSFRAQKLFNELNALVKRPTLEASIGKILCEYEKNIQETEKYLENGICMTNFAEAGLILQGCSQVYGKQVDILYDRIIGLNISLINLTRRDEEERKKEKSAANETVMEETVSRAPQAEDKKHEKKKRKECIADAENDENPQHMEHIEIYLPPRPFALKESDENPWNFPIPVNPNECVRPDNLLPWTFEEYKEKDYSLARTTFTPLINTDVNVNNFYINQTLCKNGLCWDTMYLAEKFQVENHVVECSVQEERLTPNIIQQCSPAASPLREPDPDDNIPNEAPQNVENGANVAVIKNVYILLERLPEEVIAEYKRKSLENSTKEVVKRELVVNLFRFPTNVLFKKSVFKLPASVLEQLFNYKNDQESAPPTENRKRRKKTDDCDIPLKRGKTYDLNDFEDFCRNIFVAEGVLTPEEAEKERLLQEERNAARVKKASENDNNNIQENHDESVDESPETDGEVQLLDRTCRSDSGYDTDGHDLYEPNNIKSAENFIRRLSKNPKDIELFRMFMDPNYVDPELAKDKLYQWSKFIEARINKDDSDFDIHKYGTNILNLFDEENSTSAKEISFHSVVTGKPRREISRYFVASLQLANTYNVEIFETKPGTLDPDNMHMKYLSSTRYHEEMESFHAPSEESFRDRLNNVEKPVFTSTRKAVAHTSRECQPETSKPAKKRRLNF